MDQRTCAIDGCPATSKKRDKYCAKHRARIARHGSPDIVKRKPVDRELIDGVPHKRCAKCRSMVPLAGFHNNQGLPDGRVGTCKTCRLSDIAAKRLAAMNTDVIWERAERNRKHDETRHWYRMRTLYGLTKQGYEALFDQQGGLCAICRKPESKTDVRFGTPCRLAVDHCHETGEVRGLLCDKCNRGIGMLQDSVELLESAATYLRHSRAATTRGAA